MEQSESIAELAKALCNVQKERLFALADSENPFFKSKYADLSSVWEVAREPLTNNGLSVAQTMDMTDNGDVIIVTNLLHESGEWLRGRLRIRPVKADPQSLGSAITYGRRYSLSAMLGIAQEDDDAEDAMKREPAQAKPEKKPKQQQPSSATVTEKQRKKLWAMMKEYNMSDGEAKQFYKDTLGETPTLKKASEFIERFNELFDAWITTRPDADTEPPSE